MKRIFTHLFVVVLLLSFFGTGNAWAQFENGNVYRIVCSGTNSVSLGATALSDVAAVSTSETDKSQQWYVTTDGSNYTFRNLANGRYLLGNNGTSGEWGLTESSNNFTVSTVSGNYCIRGASHSNGYGYMHKDGGNNIVSWESNAANSQWTPYLVNYSEEDLAAVWAAVDALVVPTTTVEGYNDKLAEMFTDGACTQLNSTYAAKTLAQIKSDANYTGLPAVLQAMVEKVYNEQVNNSATAWDEANAVEGNPQWDNDYAKRFRVQMYEPYSIEGEITSYLRFNAHCNMDNPTGIYANANEPIFIMVDGDIEEGAELWVAHQAGLGATNYYNNIAYTELHKGLNVVPYFNDASTLWINYVVHTYDKNGNTVAEKFPHKISDYAPLKIHIEGGHINGYYNAIGDFRAGDKFGTENLWGAVDNDDDWDYYKVRAPLNGDDAPNRDFPLLGHRQTLLFPLGQHPNADGGIEQGLLYHLDNITVPTAPYNNSGDFADYTNMGLDASNGKINIMIEAWDRIMYSELATMGLVSQSTMDRMNDMYPRWTAAGEKAEIYDFNNESTLDGKTYQEFCRDLDYSEYFNHHGCGVGAPSGYMSGGWRVCNYHYNTMESIIGKIAAEAGPTWGPAHEIGHQHQGVFNLNGQTEVTNNFFSNVAVWYMGMGTSRVNGNEGSLASVLAAFNTDGNDLYTNNIWAITHLYYRLWLYYHLAGNNTQFWPRLFELCRQVPLENGGQISGETTLLRFYQHACNAAGEDLTEFFRAHGFFEIMDNRLVGDYSNATYNVTQEQIDNAIAAVKAKNYPVNYAVLLINDATRETTLMHDGETSRSLWDSNPTAELGSVNDFIDGDVEALTSYTATVTSDGTVTMSGGEGGVGFLVLNEKGEIVSFSNKSTFELNDEAVYLLATDKATIVSVDVESETADAEVDLTLMQKELLESFIADVEAMPIDDGSYRHVGFYTNASAVDLFAALAKAKDILEAGDGGYAAAYELLYIEKEKLVNSANLSLVPFDPSLSYILTSYAYKENTMHLGTGNKAYSNKNIDQTLATSKWTFSPVETEDGIVYKIKNGSGNYLSAASKSAIVASVSSESSAATYSLIQDSPVGSWTISLSPAIEYGTLHNDGSGKVVGWSAGAAASKWYLTAVEGSDNNLAKPAVDELNVLIAKTESLIDVVGIATPCRLQTTDAKAPFYLWCNANVTSGGDASMPAAGYNILDGNDRTFLHTVYSGDSQDGLNHYLRLDMGEGNSLSEVQFSYKTRHNGDSKSHPKVIKVEGSNDLSTFEEIATISEGLPNDYSVVYESPVLSNGKPYRYIRFMVTDTYATAGTDGKGHKYFYIAEFSIPSLGDLYVKVDPEYGYVTTGTVTAAYNAVAAAKTAIEQSAPDFTDVKSTLQSAYEALYNEYNSPATDKITELQALINETKSLVAQAGTITNNPEETVALSTFNVYCNATIAEGELGDIFDDDDTSFMHTQWNGKSADSDYHYLRVDMGEGQSIGEFYFTYTTANRSYQDMPKTIVVEGANEIDSDNSTKDTFTEIATLTAADDGLPQATGKNSDYESRVLGSASTPYRYLRFRVTAIGRDASTGDIADDNGYPYFTMAKFGLTKTAYTTVTINDEYKNTLVTENLLVATNNKVLDAENMIQYTSSVELLTAQIATLQAAKEKLQAAMNEDVDNPIDKSELAELYETANALYATMANERGEVNADYAPSALTNEKLAEVKTALDAAKDKLDNSNSQTEVDEAKTALQTAYDALLVIENANVATTIDKSGLNTAIANANTLIAAIKAKGDGYYESVAGLGLAELSTALQNAQDVVGRFYLTEAQYNEVLAQLNTCYTTTNGIVALDCNSENRNNLSTLIGNVNALLSTIAVEGENTQALPLQSTAADKAFYIWCNEPAGDSDGVAGLIDKNADGTANTGTFLGTNWGADVPAYTHYIEIDLGVAGTIDQLTMDYTTRNTTHADQRPNAIKILGSNDKENYTPVTEITEGLATGQTEKWTMATSLELGAHYRYIRVAVGSQRGFFHMSDFNLYTKLSHTLKEYYTTAEGLDLVTLCLALDEAQDAAACYMTEELYNTVSGNLNTTYAKANGIVEADYTDRDALSSLIATTGELIESVKGYDYLSEEVIASANNAKNEAAVAVDARRYVSKDDYDAALAELQQAYNALLSAVKKPLKELIDATVLLKNSLYEIAVTSFNATSVGLNADNVYCNAPGTTNNYSGDNLGVDALFDDDNGNFLHTTYAGNDYDADDHYLRVDLGEAKSYVQFRYKGRSGYPALTPSVAVVQATNDLDGEWTEIKTLTGLSRTEDEVATGAIGNGVAYRYWRLMVTATHDGREHGGHPYFALSAFYVDECTDVVLDTQLKSEYNSYIYIYTTADLVAEVEDVINAATEVYDDAAATAEDCNGAITALQAEYDKLAEAIKYHDAPVRITTDEENPVLYKIISKRDNNGGKVLQFDEPESNNVTIVDATANASYQAWYFMKGENGYLIKPFNGQGNVLGVEDTSDGIGKALIVAEPACAEWIFARSAVEGCTDYYYIYVNGTNHACLSHNGGFNVTTKLGIWAGGWNTNDGGSLFKFVDAGFENDNAHYYQLSDFADIVELKTANTPEGTTVGAYENGTAYSAAYTATTTLVNAGNTSDSAACRDAYTALREASKSIRKIVPEEGKFYRIDITPGLTDARAGASMQIDDNAKLACGEYNASNARFYFTFEYDDDGNLYMKNLHTGTYLDEANAHNSNVQVGADAEAIENAKSIAINTLGTSNGAVVVSIVPTGGAMLNCTAKSGDVKAWDNTAVDKASAWVISEVKDLSQIAHTVTMNATFSSVMLGYNATVPAGVEAYNARGVDGGYVSLVKLAEEGDVIPANTPVILYRTDGNTSKTFTYTTTAADVPTETVLGGSLYQKYVKCDDGKDYYKLMIKSGEAKMYWMYKEFNAAGVSQGNTNDGGHIKCSANKIYMALPAEQQAASYGMRFVEPGTTGAQEVKTENGNVKTIYDLQGRKLSEITHPGFYIINGKKVYVK